MPESVARQRMEGAREREVLLGALALLVEIGYDRLTLDAVAARTRSSKATLYRRWASKAALVTDAVALLAPSDLELPDTGSLRSDLLALAGVEGYFDVKGTRLVGGLATAVYREPEVHEAIRQKVVDLGTAHLRALLQRAAERGQLRPDVDIELISSVVPATAFFRLVFETPGKLDPDLLRRLIEHVIVPAVAPEPARG
ncbi:TetR/AcrR family transcriptional regulator [Kibdelosporangium persicum]|uniref:Regulatory protein TetR n=1 Tax=Kibdelosporangium persicum TaxID=2698649 RepID=A0ABX2FD71_9PSEU|nr:TetR/AcrR family transcriptional regulator [Kibdelosporangium persicum]NRN68758.1 Regulatory protein TetR [Kibdelosporangium persicum]